MKLRLLTTALLVAACSASAFAEYKSFTYTDPTEPSLNLMGHFRRFSDNGRWLVGGDYDLQSGSYVVDTTNPAELYYFTNEGNFYDVADDGMVVGTQYTVEGEAKYEHAAIWKDGVWTLLPEPEDCGKQSYAMAVTADGKRIAGYAYCHASDVETGNKNYPVVWDWDEASQSYVPTCYNSPEVGVAEGQTGFYVEDMTPDGQVLCGTMAVAAGSFIPVLLVDGKVKAWDTWETRYNVPWYYKGEIWGYTDLYYVNGMEDGAYGDYFNGCFTYITDKYAFGYRTVVTDPDYEAGCGTYNYYATIYNMETDKFTDVARLGAFACGIDDKLAFGTKVWTPSGQKATNAYLGCQGLKAIEGVYDIKKDLKAVAGCYNFTYMEGPMESPMLLIDDSLTPVENVVEASTALRQTFDLAGRRAAEKQRGIRIVREGDKVRKVVNK